MYNARWATDSGTGPEQVEAHLRADARWDRPTWTFGQAGSPKNHNPAEEDILVPLDILGRSRRSRAEQARSRATPAAPPPLREALAVLGLPWPVSMEDAKTQYRTLARRHHPDTNNGDRAAEERLKQINVAFTMLRTHLMSEGLEKTN
mgnify:CR=1 FL=1